MMKSRKKSIKKNIKKTKHQQNQVRLSKLVSSIMRIGYGLFTVDSLTIHYELVQ
jgi:hypothetical protein